MATKTQAETLPAKASLLDIEMAWLELLQQREAAEEEPEGQPREDAIAAADVAIAEHLEREVQKVDGIVGFCRFLQMVESAAKEERDRQARRAQMASNLLAQVKAGAKYAMDRLGRKRIDGSRGYLLVKGNGGLQPLVITDETLLPPEVVKLEGWIRADVWQKVVPILPVDDGRGWSLKPRGSDSLIRARLAEVCPACNGDKAIRATEQLDGERSEVACSTCAGSGKASVPGAYLAERGNHLEVKS